MLLYASRKNVTIQTYDDDVGDVQMLHGVFQNGQSVQIIAWHLVANVSVHKNFSRTRRQESVSMYVS